MEIGWVGGGMVVVVRDMVGRSRVGWFGVGGWELDCECVVYVWWGEKMWVGGELRGDGESNVYLERMYVLVGGSSM